MANFDRSNPFLSRIHERILLSKKGSTKQTYHLNLFIDPSSITYQPGDCAVIFPANAPDEIDAIIHLLRLSDNQSIRDFLAKKANLQKPHPALIRKIFGENHQDLSEFIKNSTPADLIALNRRAPIDPDEIPRLFLPLLPRFYSIASSQLAFPHELHLLIRLVHYHIEDKERIGVASRFLCEDALIEKTPIPFYIQSSHNFLLPEDPNIAIIMVGSGTGLAPYRAFMQHRMATNARGRNWLFFGERHHSTDFYYQDFWEKLQEENLLRLSLAFSRDDSEKAYVQDRMWQERKDLWAWVKDGAYFYVCGDAHCMAKDVETTFHRIAMSEGNLGDEEARYFIKNLRALKCYRTDVY